MRERTVGQSGLRVSEIGLGTLMWGRDTSSDEAGALLRVFRDNGGTLIDTSPAFGGGVAEETLGEHLAHDFNREDFVIATHAPFTFRGERIYSTGGRSALISSVTSTLRRLHTDYLDVVFINAPDPHVPDEEIAQTLDYFVSSGITRYIGLNVRSGYDGYPAWRAASLEQLMRERSMPLINVLGGEYSIVEQTLDRDVTPMAQHKGMGIFAFSPLGRGVLTGKYRHSIPPISRAASDEFAPFVEPYISSERARRIVEAVAKAAEGLSRHPASVSLAWTLSHPQISSAVIGPRNEYQLATLLDDTESLPDVVISAINDVSA